MRLTPPKQVTFYISVSLAIIAVVLRVMVISGVWLLPTGGYFVLLVAYLVLLAGITLKGV
jgi:hypothetical protein